MKTLHWLDANLTIFLNRVFQDDKNYDGMIASDGDKCDQYAGQFAENGIPFEHGVAMYMLTKLHPFSLQCRDVQTSSGSYHWIRPIDWIVENYPQFKEHLPPT